MEIDNNQLNEILKTIDPAKLREGVFNSFQRLCNAYDLQQIVVYNEQIIEVNTETGEETIVKQLIQATGVGQDLPNEGKYFDEDKKQWLYKSPVLYPIDNKDTLCMFAPEIALLSAFGVDIEDVVKSLNNAVFVPKIQPGTVLMFIPEIEATEGTKGRKAFFCVTDEEGESAPIKVDIVEWLNVEQLVSEIKNSL